MYYLTVYLLLLSACSFIVTGKNIFKNVLNNILLCNFCILHIREIQHLMSNTESKNVLTPKVSNSFIFFYSIFNYGLTTIN